MGPGSVQVNNSWTTTCRLETCVMGWKSACEDGDSERNTEEKSKLATCCCVINFCVAAQIHSY